LGAPGRGWAPLSAAMTKGAVLQSAAIVGMGQKVLDITSDYAKNRVQFGRPIGTFQAVQYLTTDILLASHQARLLTMQAAWRIQSGLSYEREASIAKAFASKAASMMTRNSHEVHAGIAFMLDYDVQLYMRRAKYWETNLGDARYHQEQLAAVTL
jgi:alkylation response protein AidB-like acyl-CoA dehydrogenase